MHIQIVEQTDCAAVFIVPTEIKDHRGLAHLVEHLVFRHSDSYPSAHNLFALTALTNCQVNASTLGNHSFYYVRADNAQCLLLVLDYLSQGLLTINYPSDHIEAEKQVILRELALYRKDSNYCHEEQRLRSNLQTNTFHWGGFPELVAQLTSADVRAYKQQYYQASQITLRISGVSKAQLTSLITPSSLQLACPANTVAHDVKYPAAIQALLPSELSFAEHNDEDLNATSSQLPPLPDMPSCQSLSLNTHDKTLSELVAAYPMSASIQQGQYLPQRIRDLYDELITPSVAHNANKQIIIRHDVWITAQVELSLLKATQLLQQSCFWQPRTQGHLYAMGAFFATDTCYLWGAGDNDPTQTISYLQQLVAQD